MIVGLDGFDKTYRPYRDQVVGVGTGSGVFLHDVRHQPQIMAYQLVACGSFSCGKSLEAAALLGGGQGFRKLPFPLEM
jgi:hypothetical protein